MFVPFRDIEEFAMETVSGAIRTNTRTSLSGDKTIGNESAGLKISAPSPVILADKIITSSQLPRFLIKNEVSRLEQAGSPEVLNAPASIRSECTSGATCAVRRI